jgi:class 3 adenylate cyclase
LQIAGTLGGLGRLDYTVLGDAVNIAQRLQAEAVGGEILATAVTVRQWGTDRAEPIGLKQLKGHQELMHVYRIRGQTTPSLRDPHCRMIRLKTTRASRPESGNECAGTLFDPRGPP